MKKYYYSFKVKQSYLDDFGHMTNAMYLTIFDEARWSMSRENGFSMEDVKKHQKASVVIESHLKFKRELLLNDDVSVETYFSHMEKSFVMVINQVMKRDNEVIATAEIKTVLMDLIKRKALKPTEEWMKTVGQ